MDCLVRSLIRPSRAGLSARAEVETLRDLSHETYVPAEQREAQAHARISRSHGHQGRSQDPEPAACEGPCPPDPLTSAPDIKPDNSDARRSAPARLERRQRLSAAAAFRRAGRGGLRSGDRLFTVLACPNGLEFSRLGLAISRKAAGSSVQRNRLKRLVRESFRVSQTSLPALDVVVTARPGAGAGSNADIAASLAAHWQRIGRKCEPQSSS